MNRRYNVIPFFSRFTNRARSMTVHARKKTESRFEDVSCINALWIPVFFGRDSDGWVRRMHAYDVHIIPQGITPTPPEKTGMTSMVLSLSITWVLGTYPP